MNPPLGTEADEPQDKFETFFGNGHQVDPVSREFPNQAADINHGDGDHPESCRVDDQAEASISAASENADNQN